MKRLTKEQTFEMVRLGKVVWYKSSLIGPAVAKVVGDGYMAVTSHIQSLAKEGRVVIPVRTEVSRIVKVAEGVGEK